MASNKYDPLDLFTTEQLMGAICKRSKMAYLMAVPVADEARGVESTLMTQCTYSKGTCIELVGILELILVKLKASAIELQGL